jgi:hypothetical protein
VIRGMGRLKDAHQLMSTSISTLHMNPKSVCQAADTQNQNLPSNR